MTEPEKDGGRKRGEAFARDVATKADRRQRAEAHGQSVLAWFGAFGMIGWSVALPAIIGALVGRWLDGFVGGAVSWTLSLLLAGLLLGAVVAWSWMRREGGRRD
ncbi:MAG: AtpZ/AtpI family protein [Chloroflexi bacterium]|nr:AtpZ/AtpI family protein [Chloroflexota bacterium]